MPARKLARTITEALRDAERARRSMNDPKFRDGMRTDRRGTLRKFETVEHALEDRAKIEKAKDAKAKAKKKSR